MLDLVCFQLEQNSSNSRQCCHGHGQLPDRERVEAKSKTQDRNTVVMASYLTLFVPSWNRIAETRQCCGHGQLPDCERAEAEHNHVR